MKKKETTETLKRKQTNVFSLGFKKLSAKGIKFDVRTKGSCYVTMPTNVGKLTVYIDSMDGLTDPPLIHSWLDEAHSGEELSIKTITQKRKKLKKIFQTFE